MTAFRLDSSHGTHASTRHDRTRTLCRSNPIFCTELLAFMKAPRLQIVLIVYWVSIVFSGHNAGSMAAVAETDAEPSWKWRPEDEHPCTVKRITMEEVYKVFGPQGVPVLYPDPLVIVAPPASHNFYLRQLTREDRMVHNFPPNFEVTLSSSNSFSQHRRTVPLKTYLEEIKINNSTTSPHQLSNESWYLFGETFTDPWKEVLKDYQLPPCQTCREEYSALSFGIGNRGSGVQWHIHGPGFSEALHGRKHWVLYPPHYDPPSFHHDQSTWNWMENVYTNTSLLAESIKKHNNLQQEAQNVAEKREKISPHFYPVLENGRPYECTLEPGDLIYFPDRFHHATINCDAYTAFVSTFTSDHLYLQDQKREKVNNPTRVAELGFEL